LEAASVVRQAAKSAQEVLKPALSNNPAVAARQQAAIDETELLRQLNPLSRLQQTMKDIRFWEKRYSGANGTKTGII
jgi:hypothetical protein